MCEYSEVEPHWKRMTCPNHCGETAAQAMEREALEAAEAVEEEEEAEREAQRRRDWRDCSAGCW